MTDINSFIAVYEARIETLKAMRETAENNQMVLMWDTGLALKWPTREEPNGRAMGVEKATVFARGCRYPVARNGLGELAYPVRIKEAIDRSLRSLNESIAFIRDKVQ